ncbi:MULTISPECIES: phospholipase [Microbacterium]|uniref:aggregation-promoting factor C-terminal-like domain-containing protein n=1 Tax=Microbacterium TaxID=33882 RepID=UPI001CB6CEC9|nr:MULTISPECIES: phospholipase [Microbacterium]
MLTTRTPENAPTDSDRTFDFAPSRRSLRTARRRVPGLPALIAGGALGLAAIVGIGSTTAAVALDPDFVAAASPSAPNAQLQALTGITAEARTTLEAARAAAAGARSVSAQVEASGLDLAGPTAVDTSALDEHVDRLAAVDVVPLLLLPDLTADALTETKKVTQLTRDLRERMDAAAAERAAAEAAAEAAAKKAREAEAAAKKAREAAAALAAANTVEGAKATARSLASSQYGWGGDQFSCLDSLWTKESGWNYQAYNDSSGATGIPQSLPGSKMASAGADWQTNAATQIRWGLEYIAAAYGTPCSAWGHSQATNWY